MAPKKNSKAAIEETASKPAIRSVSTAGSNAALGGYEGTDAPTKSAIPAVDEKPKEPVDPLAYKKDGLVDWWARKAKKWHVRRPPLHDHRRSSLRIPWGLFSKVDALTQDKEQEVPEQLPWPSKKYSHILPRTSSWRAPKDSIMVADAERKKTVLGEGDIAPASQMGLQLVPVEEASGTAPPAVDGEMADAGLGVDGGVVVDEPFDQGGVEDEAAQMEEAAIMWEAARLDQVQSPLQYSERLLDHQLRPWRRSFQQSWRAPLHHHPDPKSMKPWKLSSKLELTRRLKTALFTLMPEPGQEWRLLPKEERERWRLQMPAAQYFLECKLLERMMRKIYYLNNPRYSRNARCFQALEIYREREPVRLPPYWIAAPVKGPPEYEHLCPPVIEFNGFESGKTYVAHLHILNKSPWSQRLRIIKPMTDQYFLSSDEEPFQGKILISGMFCRFEITYKPTNIFETEDTIEVRSEMDTCIVKLISTHPLPTVVFPQSLDLGYCLTGLSVSSSYTYVSKGAGCHFAMLGFSDDMELSFSRTDGLQDDQWNDLQAQYCDNNFTFFPPFIAYPRLVTVEADESQEIIVLFRPPKAGKFSGVLKVETQTGRHWEILVTGHAVDLEISCDKVDGRPFRPGEFKLGVDFGSCCVAEPTIHNVTVTNYSEVPVRFYWRVADQEEVAPSGVVLKERELNTDTKKACWEDPREFVPNPHFGVLPAKTETSIAFTFTPPDLGNYRQIARLCIDTRMDHPLDSNGWKNFRDTLFRLENELSKEKKLGEWRRSGAGNGEEQKVFKFYDESFALNKIDNMGQISIALELNLMGVGVSLNVKLLPPLLVVAGGLTVGTVHTFDIIVRNNSPVPVQMSWECPYTPYKAGVVKNSVYFQPLTGEIPEHGNQEVQVIFRARKIGAFEARHGCRITSQLDLGGKELQFHVAGHVRGPVIALSPAMLNYGLVQIDSTHQLDLTLTNRSTTTAAFKLYTATDPEGQAIITSRDKPVGLSSYGDFLQLFKDGIPLSQSYRQDVHNRFIPHSQLRPLPLNKVCQRVCYPPGPPYPEGDVKQHLVFSPNSGVLQKYQSITVKAVLTGTKCGYLRLAIICEVADLGSPTEMAIARAEIDAPRACLIPPMIDLGIQYIRCDIERDVTLRNLRALPASFNWWSQHDVGDHKFVDIEWTPVSGKVPPRGEQQLKFKFTPHRLGPFECILVCKVWKQQYPLGLLLKAHIVDIRVSFHVFPLDVEDGHLLSGQGVKQERLKKARRERLLPRRSTSDGRRYEVVTLDPPDIPCIDYGRRKIVGKVHSLKLVIRNHSPITASVQLRVQKYPSEPNTSLIREELWMLAALTGHLSTLNPNRRDPFQSAMINKKLQHPLLGRQDDLHFHYFSSAGKSMLWRRVEGAMHQALIKEGRSVAFLLYPWPTGVLKAWSEWSCEIVCFSTLPGVYLDTIICNIGRLSPFYFPIEIELLGNPLVTRINYLEPRGLQDIKETPELVLTWNTMPTGNPVVRRSFWVYNISAFHMVVEWEVKIANLSNEGGLCSMSFDIEDDRPEVHAMLVPERDGEDCCVRACVQEHLGIRYGGLVHVTFKDFLEAMPENPPFRIAPKRQVILGQGSSQFVVTFQSLEASNFQATLVGKTRIHDGQFTRRLAAPKLEFDSALEPIDKQYIYRRPSTKHVCEHVVTFFSHRTSQFQSMLIHETSQLGGDHVHLEQPNQRKLTKKGGPWADFGRKRSKVHRLEHDSDPDESSEASGPLTEEGGYDVPILDVPDALITDAFTPNLEIDLIRPLRVTLIAGLLVPRLYCNVDDTLKFELFGSIPVATRYDTRALFLTNTYLDRILFSIKMAQPFYLLNARHGIIEPVIKGDAIQRLSVLKDPQHEPQENHYRLPRDWSLQLTIRFRPHFHEGDCYPMDEVIGCDLVITFQDTHEQIIHLHGDIYFPEVTVQTESLWFGTVVCPDCVQTMDFSISNTSFAPAEWRIVTERSHQNMVECAELNGFVDWGHLKDLNKIWPVIWKATPESGRLPGREGYMSAAHKQMVTITFSPHEPIVYQEAVWIEVFRGRGCRLVLEGEGREDVILPPVLELPAPAPVPVDKKKTSKASKKK